MSLIDLTIRGLKETGVWTQLKALYVLAAHDSQAANMNWKSPPTAPKFDLTSSASPIFIPDIGYKGDGVDDYLDTNLAGNDATVFTTSSAVMGVWVHENPAGGDQYLIGQASSSGERTVLAQNDSTGSLAGRLGSPSTVALGLAPVNSVHLTVSRTDNANLTRYFNGKNAQTDSSGSPALSASKITLLSRGTADFSDAIISIAYFGSGLTAQQVADLDRILRNYLNNVQISEYPYATPEQFGAIGDAFLNSNDDLVGTDDTAALDACRDYCVATGKTMLLTSAYWYKGGAFQLNDPITIRGTDRSTSGLFLDIDNTKPGIFILGQHITCENFFIDVHTPEEIQNGQGNNGTCVTVGDVYYILPVDAAPVEGESPYEFGLRVAPPLATDIVLRDLWLRQRKQSGGGHAIATVGRTSGVTIENILCEGYDRLTPMGSFLLTHWGLSGQTFPAYEDGTLIEPFVLQKTEHTFTYHPNNIFVRNIRLRHTGRVLEHSASYNVFVDGVNIDGFDDGVLGNGVQITNITVGDEADSFAHPDDKGKVYSNIVIGNVVGWNIEGNSPNEAGTSLLDWPASSTSKYYNADGSLTKDCMAIKFDHDPISLAMGQEEVVSLAVPEAKVGMTPFTRFSKPIPTGYTVVPTIEVNGTIKVTFRNNSVPSPTDIGVGTLVAYVEKQRRHYQPEWTGCHFYNWRIHGIGTTTDLINIRNGRIFASFDNIQALGADNVAGVLLQQTRGRLNFSNCVVPGRVEMNVCDGVTFDNCAIRDTATVVLQTTLATGLTRGHILTGTARPTENDRKVVGTITEVRSNVLAFKTQNVGDDFTVDEIITGATSGATAKIADQTDGGTTGTLTLTEVSGSFLDGETINSAGGSAKVDAANSTSTFYVRLHETPWHAFVKDETVSSNTLAYDDQKAQFKIGQTIVGENSRARAVITAQTDLGTTGVLTLTSIDGMFVDNEKISDPSFGRALANGTVTGGMLSFDKQVGDFIVGQTIVGDNSSPPATAKIAAQIDGGTTGTLTLSSIVNVFVDNDPITDPASGRASVNGTTNVTVKAVSPVPTYAVLIDGEMETSYLKLAVLQGGTTLELYPQLAFDDGVGAFAVNDTVTVASASGVIVGQTGDGESGTLILKDVSGTFLDNETLKVGGFDKAKVKAVSLSGQLVTLVDGIPNDVFVGDKITYAGGVTYVTEKKDALETAKVKVQPVPAGAAIGSEIQLHRRSRNIAFDNCEISGGSRGIAVINADSVRVSGGTIRDCGAFGLLVNAGATVDLDGVTFSNNGLVRVGLEANADTRDILVGTGGTVRADRLIFKDGYWVEYNVDVNPDATGGHLRDSIFAPIGGPGTPVPGQPLDGHMLILSSQFGISGNRDSAGMLVGAGTRQGFATYNPPPLADGAGVTTSVTVTGAALGDFASASFSLGLQGILLTAWVSAADTVSVRFQNETTGPIDLGSGTLTAVAARP
ncbi:right-handed parallel beta-helix repeat-containing protein [Mesorhizobium sp. IMUNJ 23232]|uniref:right-handed parallel beta-helix repeat-containing protein n=1 Tax=Mesorhizobium sp. IMUNJ 23232 TaxID=3376064 RepID=UPI0037CC86C1